MSQKNAFIANQENFISRKFTNFPQSRFYAQKLLLYVPFFAVRKKFPFLQTKSFSFAQIFFIATQSNSFLPSAAHFNHP